LRIGLDKLRNIVYNTDMKRNEKKMPEPNGYRFRVYKFEKNTWTAFYNDTTLWGCVEYMRRWNPNQMHNWYIRDEDTDAKFEMNHNERLVMV
jgi:hypothetical protein